MAEFLFPLIELLSYEVVLCSNHVILQQAKVKQAVGMLKPQLTHESPVTAIAAVQELEELATLDINAPIREEVQQPVQQI